jgi:exopolyphosphatase/guanosine-5'-triphosphate,3'-diphosphate pyrophosphatase
VADADDIAGRIERITGIPLDVLSHEEEGLLTLLGVTRGDPIGHELLVVDVGGGSSELVFAGPGREPVAIGLRLGSARLIERHADHDPPTWAEIAAMRAAADDALTRTPRQALDEMVVVGGGATNLLRVVPSAAQDRCLDKRRIHRAVGRLLGEPSAAAAARHGIHPVRAHTLPAAAAILMSLLERCQPPRGSPDRLVPGRPGLASRAGIVGERHGGERRSQREAGGHHSSLSSAPMDAWR